MLRPSTPLQHALQRALGWLRRPGAPRSTPISSSPSNPAPSSPAPSGDTAPITFGRAGHTPIPPAASTPPASTPAAPAPRSGATTLGGTSSGAGASS